MAMNQGRAASVDKKDFSIFLAKAGEFFNGMNDAAGQGHYVQACSSAVHCIICSCDAVAVKFLGERSTGQCHDEAVRLLFPRENHDAYIFTKKL